jgi:hypothetical protein
MLPARGARLTGNDVELWLHHVRIDGRVISKSLNVGPHLSEVVSSCVYRPNSDVK